MRFMTYLYKNNDDDEFIHDSVSHSNNFITEEIFHRTIKNKVRQRVIVSQSSVQHRLQKNHRFVELLQALFS